MRGRNLRAPLSQLAAGGQKPSHCVVFGVPSPFGAVIANPACLQFRARTHCRAMVLEASGQWAGWHQPNVIRRSPLVGFGRKLRDRIVEAGRDCLPGERRTLG